MNRVNRDVSPIRPAPIEGEYIDPRDDFPAPEFIRIADGWMRRTEVFGPALHDVTPTRDR